MARRAAAPADARADARAEARAEASSMLGGAGWGACGAVVGVGLAGSRRSACPSCADGGCATGGTYLTGRTSTSAERVTC